MVAVWRKAWRSRALPTAHGSGEGPVQSNCGTSTTSGTILWTTSDSIGEQPRDFHLLSTPVLEEDELEEDRGKKLEHIKGLIMEFCGDSGLGARGRWLSELNVGWVLHLADGDPYTQGISGILISLQLHHLTLSWTMALFQISKSISICFDGWYRQEEPGILAPAYCDFVRFVEAVLRMMLPFTDAIVAMNVLDGPSSESQVVCSNRPGAVGKLQAMIDVRDALSTASEQIILSSFSSSPCSLRSTTTTDDLKDLLSAEVGKLDEAILETVDKMRTAIMSMTMGGSFSTPQMAPGIHNATRSVISYIKLLWKSYESVERIVRVKCGPQSHLTNLILEVVCSLEAKLARESESFPDQSLRFLFLINNSYFVQQEVDTIWLLYGVSSKVDEYIQNYLQVSWTPVLRCLHDPPLHCFTKYSTLAKFESKFQNTCTTQKLWKVPDPELRRRLRKAIIENVISGYTKFLQDNSIDAPRITPQAMEGMLQDLFEG